MSTRRHFLHAGASLAAGLFATTATNATGLSSSEDNEIIGHGEFRYRVHKDWADVNPSDVPITNCHEMVQDSQGRLVMIGDNPRNNVIVFDRSGRVLKAWGTMWPGGHGLTLNDEGGEDFLYIAECGYSNNIDGTGYRQNGFVSKTTMDGSVIFTIGHPMTAGAYKPGMRFQPTETAVAPNGDIYVADGYGSNYILRYDSNGRFIEKFGGNNNADDNYNLRSAHGVAVDLRDPDAPQLIVTSRSESAFKYFTLDGKWLKTVRLANMQPCRAVIDADNVYAGVCWSHDFSQARKDGVGQPWLVQSGFTLVMDANDQVVSCPGGEQPVYEAEQLQHVSQNASRTFFNGHDVCVDNDKNVFVCQWNGRQTPPVMLERVS
ncbi:MAG: hypothetical protein NXI04_16240 [Planctomycetaceae bacterium]|nr:hypothetical protein [Planctomycetaceae bacterium]